ncbi:MAG: HlyD family efflux transporter periplasmic adaptor subunit [Gammaproteobacteria bacterium]|nr:MAG: HlyD family efflux transporter periplasmic adaptor subunit [Gammaproteobacteria bacterium]
MKRLLLVVVLLAVAAGGTLYWRRAHERPADAHRLVLHGNIDLREVRLAFRLVERVREVRVEEGDRVRPGELLARLDDEAERARVAEAEARLEAARQRLARLEAGSRPEEIARGRAELAEARAQARAAQDTLHRLRRLRAKKLVSPEDVENARALAAAAAARVRAAQAALRLLEEGPRKEDIAAARAEVAAREAALRLARKQLAETRLLAPVAGIVRRRLLEPGDMASPQVPALTLARVNPVWARVYVPEPLLGRVVPGLRAEIVTDSAPDHPYPGWVGYVSPTAEFTPKNVETPELRTRLVYETRVFACNPDGGLRLGMPVTVRLRLDRPPARQTPACGDD